MGGCINSDRLNMPRSVFSSGSQLPLQPTSIQLDFSVTRARKSQLNEPVLTLRLCSVVLESINWPKPPLSEEIQVETITFHGVTKQS